MASLERRVVITGVGMVTPLGTSCETVWEALRAGRCGVRPIARFESLPVSFGGEVPDFDARAILEKKYHKQLKNMVRPFQLGLAASRLAFLDARLENHDPTRLGVTFATGTIPGELGELAEAAALCCPPESGSVDLSRWGTEGIPRVAPLWLLNHVPNILACHVSILHDAQGPNNTITQTDVGSLLAIGEAARILRRDRADMMLVGGADSRFVALAMARECLMGGLSRRSDEPERASRPFDRLRDGQVLGEGAGALMLERLDHAQRRGAAIYGEVLGFSATVDRERKGTGLAWAVNAALGQAGVAASDLDHINAHGDGTPLGDTWEARGLREALGDQADCVPVFAAKSYMGNMGPGAGAVEVILSLLAQKHGILPGTLNYEHPDPDCPLLVSREERAVTRPWFFKVSATERGQCAALVCRRWVPGDEAC